MESENLDEHSKKCIEALKPENFENLKKRVAEDIAMFDRHKRPSEPFITKSKRPWWKQVLYALTYTPIIALTETLAIFIVLAAYEAFAELTFFQITKVFMIVAAMGIVLGLAQVVGVWICKKYQKMMRHFNKEPE